MANAGQPILIRFIMDDAVTLHFIEFSEIYDADGYIIPNPKLRIAVNMKKIIPLLP